MSGTEEPKYQYGNTEQLYNSLNFFMFRNPVLPVSLYLELKSEMDLNTEENYRNWFIKLKKLVVSNSIIKEALLISSPTLYRSLMKMEVDGNKKKLRNIVRGLAKYLIRMSTRPTPFGLCSSVGSGEFGENTQLLPVKTKDYYKRARPDMEWLMKIVLTLEIRDDVMNYLTIMSNKAIYENGTRLKIPFSSNLNQDSKEEGVYTNQPTIQKTEVVEKVINLTKEPVSASVVLNILKEEYPDVEMEVIKGFLKELIKQEFIISELKPILMDTNPFESFISTLERTKIDENILKKLKNINDKIKTYNSSSVGCGEELLSNIQEDMKEIAVTKNLLQVDLLRNTPNVKLCKNVKRDIEKIANLLLRMSHPRTRLKHIEQYHNDFIEKYGIYQEVPILTLLDEDIGLGYPATYKNPASHRLLRSEGNDIPIEKFNRLSELLTQALLEGKLEVSLSEIDCEKIIAAYGKDAIISNKNAVDSMELYFQIQSKSEEAITNGDYQLIVGANPGSHSAGNTFGRFIDLFNSDIEEQLIDVRGKEQRLKGNTIVAELVYLPPSGRAANIVMSRNLRNYEIVIGTNSSKDKEKTIYLNDIVVGATHESFYLKSKRLNKMIIPVTSHMYTETGAPNICRFMLEIAKENTKLWNPFNWVMLENSIVLPRVKYKNIVLSPAEWKLDKFIIGSDKPKSEEFYRKIENWRKKWKVPKYVYLVDMDNRILLDLEDTMHLEILLHDFNKLQEGKSLRLVEIGLNQINESPLKGDEEESYFIEGVFPLIKDEKYANKSFLHIEPRKEFIKNEERIKMPGSDWLYLRIYGANQRLEEFLKLGFLELISKGKNDGWMDHAFFMRYRDPEYHIRLRIHGEAERIITEGMKNVYDWADELKNKGLLSHIEIGTYDPEIERYGGPQLINAAEELFSADSEMTAQFLSLKRFHQYHISEEVFGVINVVDILSIFFPDFEDQLSWLNRSVDYRNYKKEYQKYKEIYLHYANDYNNWQGLRTDELGKTIYELLEIRRGKLIAYAEKVHTLNNTGSLYNNIDNIIGSLIHLHLNRLIGMDREKEEQIITVARHTLHNLRYSKQMLNSR